MVPRNALGSFWRETTSLGTAESAKGSAQAHNLLPAFRLLLQDGTSMHCHRTYWEGDHRTPLVVAHLHPVAVMDPIDLSLSDQLHSVFDRPRPGFRQTRQHNASVVYEDRATASDVEVVPAHKAVHTIWWNAHLRLPE